MSDYDEDTYDPDEAEAERRKRDVGMAPYGSDQYWKNAAYILDSYKNPNPVTAQKKRSLKENGY